MDLERKEGRAGLQEKKEAHLTPEHGAVGHRGRNGWGQYLGFPGQRMEARLGPHMLRGPGAWGLCLSGPNVTSSGGYRAQGFDLLGVLCDPPGAYQG